MEFTSILKSACAIIVSLENSGRPTASKSASGENVIGDRHTLKNVSFSSNTSTALDDSANNVRLFMFTVRDMTNTILVVTTNLFLTPHLDPADTPEYRGNTGETADSYLHPLRRYVFGYLIWLNV